MKKVKCSYIDNKCFSLPRFIQGDDTVPLLKSIFSVEAVTFYNKQRRTIRKSLLKYSTNSVFFSLRLLNPVWKIYKNIGVEIDPTILIEMIGEKPQFDSSVDLSFLWDEKKEYVYDLIKRFSGIVQLPTGSGKTEIMMALIMMWELKGSSNILVVANRNSVVQTIIERFEGYNLKCSEDFSTRINVINPVGYMRKLPEYREEHKEWFKEVGMVLIDECENINNSLKTLLERFMPKYKYIYGFSASADKVTGGLVSYDHLLEHRMSNESVYNVMYYVGASLVFRKPKKRITLHTIEGKFHPYYSEVKYDPANYINSIDAVVSHGNFKKVLEEVCRYGDKVYVPVTLIEHVEKIEKYAVECGIPCIAWTSQSEEEYLEIKKKVESKEVKMVVSTQVSWYGVDIKFTDILLFIGGNYNTIIQTIGRVYRSDKPHVWLLNQSKGNDKFYYSYSKRLEVVKENYPIETIERHII